MHTQHGHAQVNGVHVAAGHKLCHGAAAALVHLPQLAGLPGHSGFIQQVCKVSHKLRRSIVGAALSAAAGVLGQANALPCIRTVALVAHIREGRVKRIGYIRRKALGSHQGKHIVCVLALAQLLNEMEHIIALQTGHAVRTDFFLVRQHAQRGKPGILHLNFRHQRRICLHQVILAVCADHRPVKPNILGLVGRHRLDFRPDEILLHQTVLLIQQPHGKQLYPLLGVLILDGQAAHHDVQLFALDATLQGAVVLIGRKVRQQIGHTKHRVALFFADAEIHPFAARLIQHPVQSQRHRRPLIFAQAAVIVCLKQGQTALFIQGQLLQVQPGRINVGHVHVNACFQRGTPHRGRQHTLAAVVVIDLLPGLITATCLKRLVARLLQHIHAEGRSFPLGLSRIQKRLVALAKALCFREQAALFVHRWFGRVQQLFFQLLCRFILHIVFTPSGRSFRPLSVPVSYTAAGRFHNSD